MHIKKKMIKYHLKNKVNPQDVTAVRKLYPVKKTQEELATREFGKTY